MRRVLPLLLIMLALSFVLPAAEPRLELVEPATLTTTEQRILAAVDERNELGCELTVQKPEMRLDLSFHTGYETAIPLSRLAGNGNRLRAALKVTPLGKQNPVYFAVEISVPDIDPKAAGTADLPGEFTVGPGRYRVDWVIGDQNGRVCSRHWEVQAKLKDDFRNVALSLEPDEVGETLPDSFTAMPTAARDGSPAHVRILVNFAPGDPRRGVLTDRDTRAITGILRAVSREPRIGRFSVIAFSTSQEKVFYTQEVQDHIDFPALGEAVKRLDSGTVTYTQLQDPASGARFLSTLLGENLKAHDPPADAIVIVSPQVMLDRKVDKDALAPQDPAVCPAFYLNYNPDPGSNPWRDTIAGVMKAFRGLYYSISGPRDLGTALRDMQARLVSTN